MKPSDLEFVDGAALLFAVATYAAAAGTAAVLCIALPRVRGLVPVQDRRAGCLDGLRGALAVGVLVHHAFTAHRYFLAGRWDWSSSSILNELGQSTVALFFMITGLLFTGKLLDARARPIDWVRLYEARFRRLTPLYLLTVAGVLASVAVLTGFSLREPWTAVACETLQWVLFVIPGRPDINRLPQTWTLIAGVNWSLVYEWLFYAGLPLLAWPLRRLSTLWRSRMVIAMLGGLLLRSAWHHHPIGLPRLYVDHFACGVTAALILRDPMLARAVRARVFKALALGCLACLLCMRSADDGLAVALALVVFLSVAAGASLFGLLRCRAALWLGEISYGIYLLHGLALYWTLHALAAAGQLRDMSLLTYAAVVGGLAAAVVGAASASFVVLEHPLMRAAHRSLPSWLRRLGQREAFMQFPGRRGRPTDLRS